MSVQIIHIEKENEMSKVKRFLSLFLAVLMIFTAALQLISCDNDTPDNEDPNQDDPSTVGKSTYVVTVKTEGGIAASTAITAYIYDTDGDIKAFKKIDESGRAVFELASSPNYTVVLDDVPEGYNCAESYPLGTTGVTITLTSGVIKDESLAGVKYQLGSIMHDFTLTASDGTEMTLSELLKTKKAVLLNFWFIDCQYCVKEFAGLNEAYKAYGDDIEVVCINTGGDTLKEMADFKTTAYYEKLAGYGYPAYEEDLVLNFVEDEGIANAFGFTVAPISVMVDRYGMVSLIHQGEAKQTQFEYMFEHYASSNYRQGLYSAVTELVPKEKPNVSAPSSEEIAAVANKGEVNVEYLPELNSADAEYSWPFVVTEKDEVACIMPSNGLKKVHSSYAIMHAKVTLKAGEAFVFDFLSEGTDTLYVLVDGKDILQISGVNEDWKEACAWVALKDGTYDVSFTYLKDDTDTQSSAEGGGEYGDIYLKDFRVIDKSEVKATSYIFRYAATEINEFNDDYLEYVDVFLNPNDGYYHVGSVDGPILVARLIYNTQFSDLFGLDSISSILYSDFENGGFMVNGTDRTDSFLRYCNYAANSKIYSYCSVTEELATYLKAFVKEYGFNTHEDTWLQLCSYYDAYGLDEDGINPAPQLDDVIKGLSAHSAYEAVLGTNNTVEYIGLGMIPRGYLYEFVPQTSGVYRITTLNANQRIEGWMFIGTDEDWLSAEYGRILYTSDEAGERICDELLISNGDGTYDIDTLNVSLVAYMEAGKSYYVDFAFNDVTAAGTFNFEVKYIGEKYDYFVSASPGPFTAEILPGDTFGDVIALGINTVVGDDGYLYHLKENGEIGSAIYADFSMATNIFTQNSILSSLESHPYTFNYSITADDYKAITAWEKAGRNIETLRENWGSDFDTNWAKYKMDDIINGIYHGDGPNYMPELIKYAEEKMIDGDEYPMELNGCVQVDERLMEILQDIVCRSTFENVDGAWRKMCYYYDYLGQDIEG